MARTGEARRHLDAELEPAPARAVLRLAKADGAARRPSPVVALQQRLKSALTEQAGEKKWSRRKTLAFIMLTCGSFWAIAALLVSRLFD